MFDHVILSNQNINPTERAQQQVEAINFFRTVCTVITYWKRVQYMLLGSIADYAAYFQKATI